MSSAKYWEPLTTSWCCNNPSVFLIVSFWYEVLNNSIPQSTLQRVLFPYRPHALVLFIFDHLIFSGKMGADTKKEKIKILQVSNISVSATKDQIFTMFQYIGRIEEMKVSLLAVFAISCFRCDFLPLLCSMKRITLHGFLSKGKG